MTIQNKYVTICCLCFDLSFIKFLINTREKQALQGFDHGNLAFMEIHSLKLLIH